MPNDSRHPRDPLSGPAATDPTPQTKPSSSSGTSSSLASVAQTWAARQGRPLQEAPRSVACERCGDSGIADYTWEQGNIYCSCPIGRAEYTRLKRWYDEMYAEEAAWRRTLLEERLAAFSARVLPGGTIPTLESLPPSAALPKLVAFAHDWNGEQGLLLSGEVGVGKTTLLLTLVRSLTETLLARKQSVRLVTVPDFLSELRAGFDPARQAIGESYTQMLEHYRTCGVLVFDDLGAEKLTDWAAEQFYLLVDHRYRQRLPIFASSNFSREALVQRLDRRVLDRLRETCTMIEVVGPNLRDQAVQQRQPGWRDQRR